MKIIGILILRVLILLAEVYKITRASQNESQYVQILYRHYQFLYIINQSGLI